jgi:hypothetical protein
MSGSPPILGCDGASPKVVRRTLPTGLLLWLPQYKPMTSLFGPFSFE